MKKLKKALTAVLFFGVASLAFGQESGKPDRFPTMAACKAAIKAGNFTPYIASFTTGHREVRDGEEKLPLEERACVDLRIVGGRGFVPQTKGEMYIFKDGKIVARFDCGNDARAIEYVPEEAPPPPPPPPPKKSTCEIRTNTPIYQRGSGDIKLEAFVDGKPAGENDGFWYYGEIETDSQSNPIKSGKVSFHNPAGEGEGDAYACSIDILVLDELDSWYAISILPLPEAPPPGQAIKLVWEHGRPKWSYVPILDCIYQFGPNIGHDWNKVVPDLERGACIAGAVYLGLALSEGVPIAKALGFPGILNPATIGKP